LLDTTVRKDPKQSRREHLERVQRYKEIVEREQKELQEKQRLLQLELER